MDFERDRPGDLKEPCSVANEKDEIDGCTLVDPAEDADAGTQGADPPIADKGVVLVEEERVRLLEPLVVSPCPSEPCSLFFLPATATVPSTTATE
jgi:hypothetical protein